MIHPVACTCVGALAFSVIVGCSAGGTANVTTNSSTSSAPPTSTPAIASGATSTAAPSTATKQWVDLQVGECVAAVPAVDVGEATVTVVDCSAPHGAEVYLLAPVAVNAAIAEVADQACAAGLDGYTGGRAGLSVTYLIDSKQDRTGAIPLPSTVICLLQAAGGTPLTGSARA